MQLLRVESGAAGDFALDPVRRMRRAFPCRPSSDLPEKNSNSWRVFGPAKHRPSLWWANRACQDAHARKNLSSHPHGAGVFAELPSPYRVTLSLAGGRARDVPEVSRHYRVDGR